MAYLRVYMYRWDLQYGGCEWNLTGEFEHRDGYESDSEIYCENVINEYSFKIPESGFDVHVV